jgi:hypothetical protein
VLLALLGLVLVSAAAVSALCLRRVIDRSRPQRSRFRDGVMAFLLPVIAGVCSGAAIVPTRLCEFPNRWQDVIDKSPAPLWVFALITFTFTCLPWIVACLSRHAQKVAISQGVFVVVLIGLTLPIALPGLQKRSNKFLCEKVAVEAQQAHRLYSVGCEEESLCYYLHRTVKEMRRPRRDQGEKHQEVVEETLKVAAPGRVVLFVHHRYFKRWLKRKAPPGSRKIHEDGHIVVLVNQEYEP